MPNSHFNAIGINRMLYNTPFNSQPTKVIIQSSNLFDHTSCLASITSLEYLLKDFFNYSNQFTLVFTVKYSFLVLLLHDLPKQSIIGTYDA